MNNTYRIEVSTHHLSIEQQAQFIQEARRAGFSVESIHNGWDLAVTGLAEQQAVVMRDGLLQNGIHSSIGISA